MFLMFVHSNLKFILTSTDIYEGKKIVLIKFFVLKYLKKWFDIALLNLAESDICTLFYKLFA